MEYTTGSGLFDENIVVVGANGVSGTHLVERCIFKPEEYGIVHLDHFLKLPLYTRNTIYMSTTFDVMGQNPLLIISQLPPNVNTIIFCKDFSDIDIFNDLEKIPDTVTTCIFAKEPIALAKIPNKLVREEGPHHRIYKCTFAKKLVIEVNSGHRVYQCIPDYTHEQFLKDNSE
jgi:hypothetical protein